MSVSGRRSSRKVCQECASSVKRIYRRFRPAHRTDGREARHNTSQTVIDVLGDTVTFRGCLAGCINSTRFIFPALLRVSVNSFWCSFRHVWCIPPCRLRSSAENREEQWSDTFFFFENASIENMINFSLSFDRWIDLVWCNINTHTALRSSSEKSNSLSSRDNVSNRLDLIELVSQFIAFTGRIES